MKNTNISSQVFTAVREAINELRKEQSIHFQTLSDEKFAIGYIYKSVMLQLSQATEPFNENKDKS